MDDPNLHRLEGTSAEAQGGLVVKKSKSEPSATNFPKPSLLGLDRLAAQKRKEREDAERLISFKDNDYDDRDTGSSSTPKDKDHIFKTPDAISYHKLSRSYRKTKDETPSHTGGVSDLARNRLIEHLKRDKHKDHKGVYASSKDKKRSSDDYYDHKRSHRRDYKDRDRYRDRDRERNYDKNIKKEPDSLRSISFKDEPRTPNLFGKDSISSSSWDDDDDRTPLKKSSWDFPTPKSHSDDRLEWSIRSNKKSKRGRSEDETPKFTPAYKYNSWASDRKRSGATPQVGKNDDQPWGHNEEDRDLWEEEQRRLDREWYNMDEGYDDENNPFSGESAEYLKNVKNN